MPILCGGLFLIPQWVFYIALMYFCFISIPNIYSAYNAQNDLGFTIMMPVAKRDLVKAKIGSAVILEIIHIAVGAVFAGINIMLYHTSNFVMDLNFAFFGIAFMMFGVFNLVFFPRYFRTAYYFGFPMLFGIIAAFVFTSVFEAAILISPAAKGLFEGGEPAQRIFQLAVFFCGILGFAGLNYASYRISAGRFEKTDL